MEVTRGDRSGMRDGCGREERRLENRIRRTDVLLLLSRVQARVRGGPRELRARARGGGGRGNHLVAFPGGRSTAPRALGSPGEFPLSCRAEAVPPPGTPAPSLRTPQTKQPLPPSR